MGSFSDYAENKLLDLVLGAQAFARVGNVFASLHTANLLDNGTGTEVSGNNYSRKSITNNGTNFPAASARSKALAVQQDFLAASGPWGTVTDTGLWDAASGGNLLLADVNAVPRTFTTNDVPYIAPTNGLVVTLNGDASLYLANALLNHVLGGPDFTPPSNIYFGLFVSGTEVSGNNYSRKLVANNSTNFPAAVAGAKALATAQEFDPPSGTWGLVDEIRIFDAPSGGNTLWSKSVTTPRNVGLNAPCRFSAGALTFSLT
jgi:hypothetical protein